LSEKIFPGHIYNFLKRKGIDLTSVIEREGKTFRWDGEYKAEDFNTALTLATEIGVLMGYYPQVANHHQNIPNVFLANIDPDVQYGLLVKMKKPKLVGLDSMNLWIEHKKQSLLRLMKRVDMFVANDAEAKQLTGERNLVKAAKALKKMGPKLIVVKKGEHGVMFYSEAIKFSFPAYPVERVVDPTGAGDTFAGGIMGYLSREKKLNKTTLKKALLYATTLSSFNVEGFGMANTAPLTLKTVNKRMRELIKFISI